MTNEEINKLIELVNKHHYGEAISRRIWEGCSPFWYIKNAIGCLHINGRLSRKLDIDYHNWWKSEYYRIEKILHKLRNFYELSKQKRKDLFSENLKLKAKIERLDKGRLSRLEKIGDIMLKIEPYTYITKNADNDWVVTRRSGAKHIYKDLLVALKDIK